MLHIYGDLLQWTDHVSAKFYEILSYGSKDYLILIVELYPYCSYLQCIYIDDFSKLVYIIFSNIYSNEFSTFSLNFMKIRHVVQKILSKNYSSR